MKKTGKRVACYIRVSTQEQKLHGLSLDAQRFTLKAFCEHNSLNIVAWYEDEGISGRKLIKKRPALQQMLNDAPNDMFDRIIFIKLDRYFRSVGEYYECQKILERYNIVWTATEEKYDLTTANGRFWVNQKLSMAEYEADQTGERIRLVNEYKVRTGQPLTGSQNLGLAFKVGFDEKTGLKNVIHDKENEQRVYDLIDTYLKKKSLHQTVEEINIKYSAKTTYNVYRKILKNSMLYGFYRGNSEYCEPYVSKEKFKQIQECLEKNIKARKNKRFYLFSGLIKCPECGRMLIGNNSCKRTTKRGEKIYVDTKKIYHYRCNNYRINRLCDFNKSVNEEKLEKKLLNIFDSEIASYVEKIKISEQENDTILIKKEIQDLKSELSRLNNIFQKGRMSEKDYDSEYTKIEKKINDLEKNVTKTIKKDMSKYNELLASTSWQDLYLQLNRENKQAFWHRYIKQILLTENGEIDKIIFF